MGQSYRPGDRRPIASRSLGWVKRSASWLANRGVSPNKISTSSMVFALLGALALLGTTETSGLPRRMLWFAAALMVQMRLLANLFDGMVAIESEKASPVGELFNEIPDRVSDTLLLGALGFVAGSSVHLGYGTSLLAMFVAYIRAMGSSAGVGNIFAGVMAKPQRMFAITLLCVFQALSPDTWQVGFLPFDLGPPGLVLALIAAGCVLTSFTRLKTIIEKLRAA